MPERAGQVALVTGASRGVGRGIAIAPSQACRTAYATGRALAPAAVAALAREYRFTDLYGTRPRPMRIEDA